METTPIGSLESGDKITILNWANFGRYHYVCEREFFLQGILPIVFFNETLNISGQPNPPEILTVAL